MQILKTKKGGWGWGSISLARRATAKTAGDPLRPVAATVQFRIVGAIGTGANSAVISMALRQNWAEIAHDMYSRELAPASLLAPLCGLQPAAERARELYRVDVAASWDYVCASQASL